MDQDRTVDAGGLARMPVGTVVRDRRGHVWLRRPKGWQTPGRGGYRTSAELPVPVDVLSRG